jgi:hypothetical protein
MIRHGRIFVIVALQIIEAGTCVIIIFGHTLLSRAQCLKNPGHDREGKVGCPSHHVSPPPAAPGVSNRVSENVKRGKIK